MDAVHNLIYDVGMHIGQDTEFYIKKGFNVIAVEANPLLVAQAQDKFSDELKSGQLTIIDKALYTEETEISFYLNEGQSEWSSFDERIGNRQFGAKEIKIKTTTINKLFKKYGIPYFMKIDIEGADQFPISGLWHEKIRPAYISYESSQIQSLAELYCLGYKKFKLVKQRQFPDLVLPKIPEEGKYVEHTFPLGSSGPFGEETPDIWSGLEDCVTDYLVYKHFRRVDKRYKQDWADFHAKSDRWLKYFNP